VNPLVFTYALFALAAGARSTVQIATRFDAAPLPYALSAAAAALYLVAAMTLGDSARHRIAFVACCVELAGVLSVGTLGMLAPGTFPDETVWSGYGAGYGYIPLVLPVLGLMWLSRAGRWEASTTFVEWRKRATDRRRSTSGREGTRASSD
jgi:hypothetical protein